MYRNKTVARFLSAWLLIAVSAISWNGLHAADFTASDKKAYLQSLSETSELDPGNVSRRLYGGLVAIVPYDDPVNTGALHGGAVRWDGTPGESRVLVASFMKRADYENYYKAAMESGQLSYTLKKSLWVTVVPDLKNRFMGETCPPTGKRVKKSLGLRPQDDYDVILEFWIDPQHLFRPSPDPETTDHTASIAYKNASGDWVFPVDNAPFLILDDSQLYHDHKGDAGLPYRSWFSNQAETTYNIGGSLNPDDPSTWGWPWTRLGYTYDWGSKTHIGPSEFVVFLDPSSSTVTVELRRAIDDTSTDWKKYFNCTRAQVRKDNQEWGQTALDN